MDATLLKGLRVLECLASSPELRGVSDLARELGLPTSNIHRTLATLVNAGYVRCDAGTRRYGCTLKLFELGSRVADRVSPVAAARPLMQQLSRDTRETVHLSTLSGCDVVYLDKVESPQPIRAYSTVGGRAPAHCVASGKALLAALNSDELALLFPDGHLPPWTERTLPTVEALTQELNEVRRQGYAENHGEWRVGVGGIAAPILDSRGRTVAAVGVSGPVERIAREQDSNRAAVLSAAAATSRELGYPRGLSRRAEGRDRRKLRAGA